MPFSYKHHLEHTSPGQDLKFQDHQLYPLSQTLGEKKVRQFEELARNSAEQDIVDDIVNWSKYLLEQLKDEQLVKEYNAWSEEYFKPQFLVNDIVKKDPEAVSNDFKNALRFADWSIGNDHLDEVSSMMLYDRRLSNQGLYVLGNFQRFWLILRLDMWAISPQKTDHQLRELYGVAEGQPGEILGLRYKPLRDDSPANISIFFPLGHILCTEAFKSGLMSDNDFERWMDDAEWTKVPIVLALGIRDDGRTDRRKNGKEQFLLHPQSDF